VTSGCSGGNQWNHMTTLLYLNGFFGLMVRLQIFSECGCHTSIGAESVAGELMKRFEKFSQSPELAGQFMAQVMQCYACPLDMQCFESNGKACCEVWTDYMNEEIEE